MGISLRPPSSAQVVNQIRALNRTWTGERRPEGVFDILLDRLLGLRADLCCDPVTCNQHNLEELP